MMSSLALLFATSALAVACAAPTDDPSSATDEELRTSNEKTAFTFFVGKGLSEEQSAAIVGNLDQESSIDPSAVQLGGGLGRGIAQWSVGARWNVTRNDNVTWFAASQGASPHALGLQLAFIWYELETFSPYGLASLRAARSVEAATLAFQEQFEACGRCNAGRRVAAARAVLATYGHGG